MKKKLLYGFAVIVIATIVAWNVNVSSKRYGLSDISLANVEALAQGEDGSACKWKSVEAACGCGYWALCDSDGNGYVCDCGDMKWYPS